MKTIIKKAWIASCVLLALGFYPLPGFGVASNGKIEGIVVKYNKRIVTLRQTEGGTIQVSRKNIPSHYKLETGLLVHVPGSSKKLMRRLKRQSKK